MNFYVKVFLVSALVFALLMGGALVGFNQYYQAEARKVNEPDEEDLNQVIDINIPDEKPVEPVVQKTELELLVEASDRINVLAIGTDGERADTIMVISYNPDTSEVDIISIPRDTYHPIPGKDEDAGWYRMNAVYALPEGGGSKGMQAEVSRFLGIPIQDFVRVKYSGLVNIVGTLGGITVNIPYLMDYEDPWAKPPLRIYFEPGTVTLNGQQSMEYLRWRKNSDGSREEGDIQRIKRQQDFVIKLVEKALTKNPIAVIKSGLSYVYTEMTIDTVLKYSGAISSFDTSKIRTHTIKGEATMTNGKSYYIHDPAALEELLLQIYRNDQDR